MKKKYLHEYTLRELLIEGFVQDAVDDLPFFRKNNPFKTQWQKIEDYNDELIAELGEKSPFWNDVFVHAELREGRKPSWERRLINRKKFREDENKYLKGSYLDATMIDEEDIKRLRQDRGDGKENTGMDLLFKHFIHEDTTVQQLWQMHDLGEKPTKEFAGLAQIIQCNWLSNHNEAHESFQLIGAMFGDGEQTASQVMSWTMTALGTISAAPAIMAVLGTMLGGPLVGSLFYAGVASFGAWALVSKASATIGQAGQKAQEEENYEALKNLGVEGVATKKDLENIAAIDDKNIEAYKTQLWKNMIRLEYNFLKDLISNPHEVPDVDIGEIIGAMPNLNQEE